MGYSMTYPRIPKFEIPFRLVGDSFAVISQDSQAEIEQGVEAVLRTRLGSRIMQPLFGVPEYLFLENGVNADLVRDQVLKGEPRARFSVSVNDAELGEMISRVLITMKETNADA